MGQTLTIRLTKELSQWLASLAVSGGISQSKVVVDKLEIIRKQHKEQEFFGISGAMSKDPPKRPRRKLKR